MAFNCYAAKPLLHIDNLLNQTQLVLPRHLVPNNIQPGAGCLFFDDVFGFDGVIRIR